MNADTKTCEGCGTEFTRPYKKSATEWAKYRFCSRECGRKGQGRPGRPRGELCKSGRHPMTGDNLRTSQSGRRSCKACSNEKERERRKKQRASAVKRPRPRRVAEPAPIPVVPTSSERPVWRPAGFSAEPNSRRSA